MALIFDLADPQELQGFVRGLQQELEANQFVLAQFLPNLNIDDIEFRVTQGMLQDQDAAMVRAWDTESPIGGRQGLSRLMGELPPISKKIPLTEEQRLRKRALERGNNRQLVEAIFDDAANMARAVAARIELLRGEALYSGGIVINENGVYQPIPMNRKPEHDVAPAVPWSDTENSTPINDEIGWRRTYRLTNGFNPGLAVTSDDVITNLSLNAQYRQLATFNGVTPPFLNLAQINQIRATYQLPPLFSYDVQVRVDGDHVRPIPADRLIYVPPAGSPLGRTFTGTTAEALELVEARQIAQDEAPGMVSVVEKTFDPVATWTKAVAIALPVLINPDLTLAADVQ